MFHRTIETVPTVYLDRAHAERVAGDLQKNDPDWTYTVEDTGAGTYRVAVRDEAGEFISYIGT